MDSGEQHAIVLDYKTTVPWQVDIVEYPNDGGVFNVEYDYDSTGAVNKVYPAGDSAHPYWQLKDTDQGFRPKVEAFGNGLVTTRDYYSLTNGTEDCVAYPSGSCLPGRLRGILTENGATASSATIFPVQNTQYTYDGNGNVASFVPGVGAPIAELYNYDAFDRLSTHLEQIPAAPGTVPIEAYSYDLMGNITVKNADSYKYQNAGHPFQVTSTPGAAYGYDNAGNQTTRNGTSIPGGSQTLEYNEFNMPWRITTGSGSANQVEFEYDAFGSRVIKRKLSGGSPSQITLDIAELYEQDDQYAAGVSDPVQRTHKYRIYANRQVAQVTRIQVGSTIDTSQDTTVYLHDDIIGSASVITDSGGNLVEQRKYSSFGDDGGDVNYAATGVLRGFTGADEDADLGLVNMRGRLYDPKLGRFITPDPFVTRPYNAQGLNRYAYVENNPLKFVDPTGFDGEDSGYETGGFAAGQPARWQIQDMGTAGGEAAGAAQQAAATESQQAAAGAAAEASGSAVAGGRGNAAATTADPTDSSAHGPTWTAGNHGGDSNGTPAGGPGSDGTGKSLSDTGGLVGAGAAVAEDAAKGAGRAVWAGGYWLGANGKWNSIEWGGNGATKGISLARAALDEAGAMGRLAHAAGAVGAFVGIAVSGVDLFGNVSGHQWGAAIKDGLDIAAGVVGFFGPVGFFISFTYFTFSSIDTTSAGMSSSVGSDSQSSSDGGGGGAPGN
jgi:RHS repeat-associated protein